ncbi:MAG: CpaD family pilus assembly protein [Alphaproteobacteria bacterium]
MNPQTLSPLHASRALSKAFGLACGAVLVLAGCTAIAPYEVTGEVPADYRMTHPIAIEENLQTIDIPVGLSMAALSGGAKANIAGFAQRFLASGSSIVAVVAPSGSPNETRAAAIAVEIEDVMRRTGVASDKLEYRVYRAGARETNAPVRIAFNNIVAHTAPCLPWSDQVTETAENGNYQNFGCATQNNLAAIVASPLDLLYPRGLTPADAGRRAAVLEAYRNGESFTSDYSGEQGGEVAQGVGQ